MAKKDRRIKYDSDTEKPVMISVRLPRELYDRLERYASEHRQHISALVKDGVEMRLETDADPRSRSAGSATDATEFQIDGASILRDMQAILARHDTQMHALMQAIERQSAPAGNGAYDSSHTGIHEAVAVEQPSNVPAYDTTKYRLGKLCPQGHDYHGTGQSLRVQNKAGYCLACNAEQQREGRARRRRSTPQMTP